MVEPAGTRSWIQRLVIRGRRPELGLGAVALVSLAESRELALVNRKQARSGGGSSGLVFPMRSGKPISASTLPKMLQYHGIAAVAHGFRSSFRD